MSKKAGTHHGSQAKNRRRAIAGLVAAAVLLGLLAGCGGAMSQSYEPVADEVLVEKMVEVEAEEAGFAAPEMAANLAMWAGSQVAV